MRASAKGRQPPPTRSPPRICCRHTSPARRRSKSATMSDDPFTEADDPAAPRARSTPSQVDAIRRARARAKGQAAQVEEAAEGQEDQATTRPEAPARSLPRPPTRRRLRAWRGLPRDRRDRGPCLPPLSPQQSASTGGGADDHSDYPRGLHPLSDRGARQARRPTGQLREGQRPFQVPESRQVRRRRRQGPRGFLFPDTFELVKHAKAADLVQLQLEDFKRRIAGVDMSYARAKNLTTYDVLTIASMIEHEAGLESQRKLVAAVIYNRLHEGMPLGIDATTRFATGNYTRPLTESELAVDSPYNTRTHTGLPPGPIDSPGLASIEAAAHPAKVDYLFYVAEPGACNKLAFSSTEAEFNADVESYNSAREAAGGNSPDSCGE